MGVLGGEFLTLSPNLKPNPSPNPNLHPLARIPTNASERTRTLVNSRTPLQELLHKPYTSTDMFAIIAEQVSSYGLGFMCLD